MGLLQEIKNAYKNGKISAGIIDNLGVQNFVQKPCSKKNLIYLVSEFDSYLNNEEKRNSYGLVGKIAYDFAFRFCLRAN